LKIIYFASIRESIGVSQEKIKISEPCSILELVDMLIKKDKKYKSVFSDLKKIKCALNFSYVDYNTIVSDEDELAFFPPVTGG